jgi:hypothetical protein
MKTAPMIFALALGACGSDSTMMMKMIDASNVPSTVTISGTASERMITGTTPVSGLTVAAYSNAAPSTVVAMTTTDTSGNYSLAIPTMGQPVDGFIKASKTGYLDTYLYAPAPLVADFAGASLNILTQNEFDLLSGTLCNGAQDAAKGTIAVEVIDTANATVGGAMVASTPAATKYCYDNPSNGLPDRTQTMTNTDGVAIMFNVTGSVMVSASKSGATFKTHTVNAIAGAFTTTLITE